MSLSIGIVGLPNAGKSTLFNALVKGHQAKVADYPFTTIEPNVGIVEVPDERLEKIAKILSESPTPNPPTRQSSNHPIIQSSNYPKIIPATIEFIDIAGLVKNAHQGEGLGNQFLGHIREVDAIVQVIDLFSKSSEPNEAKEIINIELELAEIQKPTIYVYNIHEKEIPNFLENEQPDSLYLSAKMEADLIDLEPPEAQEYLDSFGLKESGLNRLIKESYQLLNLITFYTLKLATSDQGPGTRGQIQAWPILKNTKAPQAAGKVHTDMERGFIAADVVHFDDFLKSGGWHQSKETGKLRSEGKDYKVQDGDIVHFKFNV